VGKAQSSQKKKKKEEKKSNQDLKMTNEPVLSGVSEKVRGERGDRQEIKTIRRGRKAWEAVASGRKADYRGPHWGSGT